MKYGKFKIINNFLSYFLRKRKLKKLKNKEKIIRYLDLVVIFLSYPSHSIHFHTKK